MQLIEFKSHFFSLIVNKTRKKILICPKHSSVLVMCINILQKLPDALICKTAIYLNCGSKN